MTVPGVLSLTFTCGRIRVKTQQIKWTEKSKYTEENEGERQVLAKESEGEKEEMSTGEDESDFSR